MRRRRVPKILLSFVVAALALSSSSRVHAYERQWHVGVGLGYALVIDPSLNGFGGGVHLTYGLTDVFNAMLEVDLTAHTGGDLLAGNASLGMGYVIDILEWVPYVGLMAGFYDFFSYGDGCGGAGQPGCVASRIGFSVPVGLDYQLTRSFAVGGHARYHLLPIGGSTVQYLNAFARAEYVWGF